MHNKYKFENDILDVLKNYGYNTKGIQHLSIEFNIDKYAEICISYIQISEKEGEK